MWSDRTSALNGPAQTAHNGVSILATELADLMHADA